MTRIIDKDGVPLDDPVEQRAAETNEPLGFVGALGAIAPADVASEAVGRLTLAAERAEAKDAFHAATADAGDLRFLLARDKARGEEIERLNLLRFSPAGDNHHNAAACPYCSPNGQAQALRIKALEEEMAFYAEVTNHTMRPAGHLYAPMKADLGARARAVLSQGEKADG